MPNQDRRSRSQSLRLQRNDSDNSLINAQRQASRVKLMRPHMLIIYDLLRALKLQVLAHISKWTAPTEHRKICIYKNRRIAVLHSLIHLPPLIGAITLLTLNWMQYFIGTEFSESTTIQFVAKLHELLMQTSIAELILHIIRNQAVNYFLPLGALSALMQTFQISYLWSLDFWSAITSKTFDNRRKAVFIIVPLLVILTTLVGPSSAVLMIPRSGVPRVVDTKWGWVPAPLDEMFPNKVNNSNGLGL